MASKTSETGTEMKVESNLPVTEPQPNITVDYGELPTIPEKNEEIVAEESLNIDYESVGENISIDERRQLAKIKDS